MIFLRIYEEFFENDIYNPQEENTPFTLMAELYAVINKTGKIIRLEKMDAAEMICRLVSCLYAPLRHTIIFGHEILTKDGCIRIYNDEYIVKETIILPSGNQKTELGRFTNSQNGIVPAFIYKNIGARKILPRDVEKEYILWRGPPENIDNMITMIEKLNTLFPDKSGIMFPKIIFKDLPTAARTKYLKRVLFSPSSESCEYYFVHDMHDSVKMISIFDLFIQFFDIICMIHNSCIVHGNICIQNMMLSLVSIYTYIPGNNKRQAILFGWENARQYDINDPEFQVGKIADLSAFISVFDSYMKSQNKYYCKEKMQDAILNLNYEQIKILVQCIYGM
jgi:hypothetical protein